MLCHSVLTNNPFHFSIEKSGDRERKVKTHKLIQLLKLSLYFHCVGVGEKEPNFRFHLRKSVLECEGRIIKCPPIP